jgi:hypothetical protein
MSKEINEETIKEFIVNYLDITDFGYLVVPDDERLNSEAMSIIRAKFKAFIKTQPE